MTILTEPAGTLTSEALASFLAEQIPESVNLEYKAEYSPRVLQSIAAMANTNGGVILLGVDEARGLPAPKPRGVPLSELSALVDRCWSLFDPPFRPEVVPVRLDDDAERYVLLVRVDRTRVERPVLLEGRVKIRLEGRNATAGRSQIVALFAEQHAAPERVHGVALGYGARNVHPLLAPDEEGLGIRVALSAHVTSAGVPFLGTAVHQELAELLESSPLERWIRQELIRPPELSAWERAGRNTSSLVTFLREPVTIFGDGLFVSSQCVLDAPHGPRRGGRAMLLLGLALRPREELYRALALEGLYELAHVLFATALDVIGQSLFPQIVGTGLWEPIGPFLHVDPGQSKTLDDYVDFGRLRRAPGNDVSAASFEVQPGEDVRDPSRRDELIKGWLVETLLNAGYTGAEEKVLAFEPPPALLGR
jgi:hypothetical protein